MHYTTLAAGMPVHVFSTDKAIAFRLPDQPRNLLWIPRSLCENGDEIQIGDDSGNISVQTWFVNKGDLPT